MIAFHVVPLPTFRASRQARTVCPTSQQAQPATSKPQPSSTLSNVLIIAANRGLGAYLADHLQHTPNLHTTHRPNTPPSSSQTTSGNAHPLDAVDRAATADLISDLRPRTIVSCLGGDIGLDYLPDFDANKNLIDAAIKADVQHFVMLSALGAGNSEESVPSQVRDTLRPLLLEKSRAEAYIKTVQNIRWTIVRPAPIVEGDGTGEAVATEDVNCYGTITRPDLASIVAEIANSQAVTGKTLHVVDRKGLLITAPYVRPLEFWERLPFDEFTL